MSEPERVEFPPLTVHRVPKRCSECKREWEGNALTPAPKDGTRVWGTCDTCIDREEAARKALTAPVTDSLQEVPITPPRKVFGYDD